MLDAFPDFRTEKGRELLQKYRNVFSHREAPEVLYHMLMELGVFETKPAITPEDVALKVYGARLLNILGGGEVKQNSITAFINQLKLQPLQKEKHND